MKAKKPLVLVLSLLTSLALCIALGLGAGGCGDTDEATTTQSATGSITGAAIDSTADPAATATEGTMGIGSELISKTRTLADVTGEIPEGKFLVTAEEASKYDEGTYIVVDPATIDPALQAEFQETQSDLAAEEGLCILWLGDENRGDELNAAVTNRLFIPEGFSEKDGYKRNFVGALPSSIPLGMERYYLYGDVFAEVGVETTLPALASGVFVGLIPVANPEEPDTEDHYMEVYVPLLDETFYARVSLDDWGSIFGEYLATRPECLDLRSSEQRERPYEWIVGSFWLRSLLFTHGSSLSSILQPGDWVVLSFSLDKDLAEPFVDSRGVQYINRITVQRFQENAFESVRDIIYPGEDIEMGA
jgi:hypothetical protein